MGDDRDDLKAEKLCRTGNQDERMRKAALTKVVDRCTAANPVRSHLKEDLEMVKSRRKYKMECSVAAIWVEDGDMKCYLFVMML